MIPRCCTFFRTDMGGMAAQRGFQPRGRKLNRKAGNGSSGTDRYRDRLISPSPYALSALQQATPPKSDCEEGPTGAVCFGMAGRANKPAR